MIRSKEILNFLEKDRELRIVMMGEHQFSYPKTPIKLLGTTSVRGCYAICIHHHQKSAIIHWCDNTKREELDRAFNLFLGDKIKAQACHVSLVGGWKDHPESNASGLFLQDYFKRQKVILHYDYFQKKQSADNTPVSELNKSGFYLVILDVEQGGVKVTDDWMYYDRISEFNQYAGPCVKERLARQEYTCLIQVQDNSKRRQRSKKKYMMSGKSSMMSEFKPMSRP